MNSNEIANKVRQSMRRQCDERGYATAVDVLMDIGMLTKKEHENWRYGRVDYLERVCIGSLGKLSAVRRAMRQYAQNQNLKPSFCYYKRWGVKKKGGQGRRPVIPLRFSKSGDLEIERQYATHYVDLIRTEHLKMAKADAVPAAETEADGPEE